MKTLIARAVFLSGIWISAAQASDALASTPLSFDYNLVRSRAEAQNEPGSQFLLGEMHRRGQLVKQDAPEAVRWYLRAAAQGHAQAQIQLGLAFLHGDGVVRDVAQARRWLQAPAEDGNVEAQYQLGNASRQSDDGTASLLEAVRWYSKAAEQNHSGAQYELGLIYADGMGVKRNVAAGLFWLQKAADNGHRIARQRADAIAAESVAGSIVAARPMVEELEAEIQPEPVVQKVAPKPAKRTARAPKPPATIKVVKKTKVQLAAPRPPIRERSRSDAPRANHLLRVAGSAAAPPVPGDNDLDGQFSLGVRYLKGEGIGQDIPKGLFWLRKAAGKEHPMALFVLGQLYVAGYGVDKNLELGAKLYREAAKRGVPAARAALAQLQPAGAQENVENAESANAESADPESVYNSGIEALNDADRDLTKQAISMFEKAAAQGYIRAQAKLGEIFFQGKRTRRDYDAAFVWYQAAAQGGDADSQYWLGEMYRRGLGTSPDNALAAKWFRQAARLGHPMARDRMGGCIVCD